MGRETVASFIAIIAAFCWSHPLVLTPTSQTGADMGPLGYGLLLLPILTAIAVSASKEHLAILFGSSQVVLVIVISLQLSSGPTFWLHGLGVAAVLGLMQAMEHAAMVTETYSDSSLNQSATNIKYF
ncbi:hypothetical protein [Ferrimonas lipolytica]|uniref:Uncharacterized protein n=1 Tax=Ferrimonas lipolytica TaxID=2724191 RepID=A0A6H1UC04_9GAMM|nr:hypothetical protein [Ferrimonas lipolytica]QIZ76179.1 hypothetical protein HER31_04290 [Ferrimonas lipolytica]